jgi:hypothetical protein
MRQVRRYMALVGGTIVTIHVTEDHRGLIGEAEVHIFVDGNKVYAKHQHSGAVQAVRLYDHIKIAMLQLQFEELQKMVIATNKKQSPAAKTHRPANKGIHGRKSTKGKK